MVQGDITIWIPNPHQSDIGRDLLARLLRQAHIDPRYMGTKFALMVSDAKFAIQLR